MTVTCTPTPFGTLHFTVTSAAYEADAVASAKKALRKAAKGHGRPLTVREHTIGHTVTVFAIYRKTV